MYPDHTIGGESILMDFVLLVVLIIAVIVLGPLLLKKIWKRKAKTKAPVDPILLNDPTNGKHFTTPIGPTEKTVSLYNSDNAAEAGVLKTIVEENDIRCLPVSFNDLAYNGMWQTQKGWGILRVFEKDKSRAEELLNNYLKERAEGKTDLSETDGLSLEDNLEEIVFISQKGLGSGRIFMFTAIILFCIKFLESGIPSGIGLLLGHLFKYLFK